MVIGGLPGNCTQLFTIATKGLGSEDEFLTTAEPKGPHWCIDLCLEDLAELHGGEFLQLSKSIKIPPS